MPVATRARVVPTEDVQFAEAKAKILERIGLAITETFFRDLGPHATASKALVEAFLQLAAETGTHYLRRGPDTALTRKMADAAREAMRGVCAR